MYECYTMTNMITKFFTNPGRFIKMFFAITAIVFFAWGPVGMNSASADINDLLPNNNGQISSQFLKIEEKGITNNGFNIQINIMPQLKTPPKDSNPNAKVDILDNLGDFWSLITSANDTSGSGYSSGSMTGVFVSVIDKKTNEPVNFIVSSMNSSGFVTDILNKITNKYLKSSQNVTEGFWQDTSLFFDQETFATQVGISGLAADNEYLVQVFIVEKGLLSGSVSWSDELTSEEKLTIKTTKKATGVQINQTTQTTQAVGLSNKQNDICSNVTPSSGVVNWAGFYCQMIKVIVEIITFIPNAVAAVTGSLADMVMNISIGHGTYQLFEDTMFDGWKVVRDISNLIIIFSLFIAAFTLILGWGNDDGPEMVRRSIGDPKQIVARAIMVAIFINFSFFFCRVLIDAGNVSGRFIYNQIGTTGDLGGGSVLIKGFVDSQSSDVKNISLAMLSQVQPQKLLISDQSTSTAELGLGLTHAYLVTGFMVLIFNVILIYIFLIMLFLFMGRIVFLSLSTILSPLAFASAIIPGLAKQKYIGFEDWLKNMVGNAFVGTVFFFFIYLSIMFSNIDITPLGTGSYGTGFIGLVVGMLFKVSLIFGVLFFGKKIAVDIAGVVGEMAVSVAGKIGGMATGSVVGGAALLARQTIGAKGARMADDEDLQARVAKGGISGWAAQRQMNFGKKLASSDYDVRNVKFGGKTLNERTAAGGYDMNSAMKSTGKGFYGDVEKAEADAKAAAEGAKLGKYSKTKLAEAAAQREYDKKLNKELEESKVTIKDKDGKDVDIGKATDKDVEKSKKDWEEEKTKFDNSGVGQELKDAKDKQESYKKATKDELEKLTKSYNNAQAGFNNSISVINTDIDKKKKEIEDVDKDLDTSGIDSDIKQKQQELDTYTSGTNIDFAKSGKMRTELEKMKKEREEKIANKKNFEDLRKTKEEELKKLENTKTEKTDQFNTDYKTTKDKIEEIETKRKENDDAVEKIKTNNSDFINSSKNKIEAERQKYLAKQKTNDNIKRSMKDTDEGKKLKDVKEKSKNIEKDITNKKLQKYQDSFGWKMGIIPKSSNSFLNNEVKTGIEDQIRKAKNEVPKPPSGDKK
jgi:hypothetical protein